MKNRSALQFCLSRGVLIAVAVSIAGGKATGAFQDPPGTVLTAAQRRITGAIPSIQGYQVEEIRVTGAKALPNELIRVRLGIIPGEVYEESKLRTSFEELFNYYGTAGYVTLQLQPVFEIDEQRKVLKLTVKVDEGSQYFFNRIRFIGNATIPEEVLRREVLLSEGFVFNSSELVRSLSRLNQLGVFEEIKLEDFQIAPAPDEPKVDVILRVQEKRR